jgi:hypothetical protein
MGLQLSVKALPSMSNLSLIPSTAKEKESLGGISIPSVWLLKTD